MKKEEKIILPTDENIVKFVENVSGWLDINGRFWGSDKNAAIYSSITHKKCECGKLMSKNYTACCDCRHKADIERYNNLPFKEWDGEGLVYSKLAEQYFRDESEIEDYCEENEVKSEDMRFVLCDPAYIPELTGEGWDDLLPEDVDHFPNAVEKAMEAFNEAVKAIVISYFPSKIRTTIKITI